MVKHYCDLCGNPAMDSDIHRDAFDFVLRDKGTVRASLCLSFEPRTAWKRDLDVCYPCLIGLFSKLSVSIDNKIKRIELTTKAA